MITRKSLQSSRKLSHAINRANHLSLPLQERVLLAERLWESVHEDSDAELSADESAMLDEAVRRNAEMEQGIVKGVSHEEVMAALRKANGCD